MGFKTTNYKRGRDFEYRTRKRLIERGYSTVVRASGSHSPFDLIAMDPKVKLMLLVQCKNFKMTEGEIKRLHEELDHFSGTWNVKFIHIDGDRKK